MVYYCIYNSAVDCIMFDKEIRWDPLKSKRLKKVRGVSFEEIIKSRFVVTDQNPNRPHQKIILFDYKNYIWVVPYVEEEDYIFLKTLYPNRKYTRIYKNNG